MRDIDSELKAPHVVETRRMAFENFVRDKSSKGYPGTGKVDAVLCNRGFYDFFGTVTFDRGMLGGCWIISDGGDNANILTFPSRAEAKGYGKTILPILRSCGYSNSKVDVERVVVHTSSGSPFLGCLAPRHNYDQKERYILRLKIRK